MFATRRMSRLWARSSPRPLYFMMWLKATFQNVTSCRQVARNIRSDIKACFSISGFLGQGRSPVSEAAVVALQVAFAVRGACAVLRAMVMLLARTRDVAVLVAVSWGESHPSPPTTRAGEGTEVEVGWGEAGGARGRGPWGGTGLQSAGREHGPFTAEQLR